MATAKHVEESLRDFFISKPTINGLLEDRFFMDMLPQNISLPAVSITRLSSIDEMHLGDRAKAVKARIQIECEADTRKECRDVIKAIKDSNICQVKGTTFGTDIRGVSVEEGTRDYHYQPTDGSDNRRYVTSLDLVVSYLED